MEKLKLSDNEKKDFFEFDEFSDYDGSWVISVKKYPKCNYIMKEMNLNFDDYCYIYFVLEHKTKEHKTNGSHILLRNKKESEKVI